MSWVRRMAPVLLAAALMAMCLGPALMAITMAMGPAAMNPATCGRTPAPRACCVVGGPTLAVVAAPALPRPLPAALIPRTPAVAPAMAAAPQGSTLSPSPPAAAARPRPLRV
ncbi:MAG TPA: hypothetical protein VIC54_01990 [Terriglobales bacterium]|jgi:hypothetical protein